MSPQDGVEDGVKGGACVEVCLVRRVSDLESVQLVHLPVHRHVADEVIHVVILRGHLDRRKVSVNRWV